MRRFKAFTVMLLLAGTTLVAEAGTGRIVKVLPQFLDKDGKASLSPSLYERDAYQAELRKHPEKIGSMQFMVQWKSNFLDKDKLHVKIELRTSTTKNGPPLVLEQAVKPHGFFGTWDAIKLEGEAFKNAGDVISWRATLWEGETQVAEQKSFLW